MSKIKTLVSKIIPIINEVKSKTTYHVDTYINISFKTFALHV